MPGPVIFVTAYAIKDGELDAFRQFLGELLDVFEANDPSALAIDAYLNEAETEAAIVQISQDAESIKNYWQVVHQHTGRALGQFVQSPTSVQVYGPTENLMLERTRHSAGSGAAVTVMPEHVGGFTRLGAAASGSLSRGAE